MDRDPPGSVTAWIDGLREGESLAERALWDRYFASLVAMAGSRLDRLTAEADGEDIALSALNSVMGALRNGRLPELADRTGLWPLLVTLTQRKSIDQRKRLLANKRSAWMTEPLGEFRAIVSKEPSPEFAAVLSDELERLLTLTDDPKLKAIALKKLEGYTNEEIAQQLSMSVRTVIRKLNRVRQEWDQPFDEEDQP
ncbi:RNA polymerase sigma factor [Pseudobythopirellula maris]|uniref:RNA polymerase sigma factor n=1 Tax=Pseudobythopirellula maris TaxID=2527991 RepID=A0A5C5ZHN8_9BACT|nr:ECF-type sigma factor [Pseudobythopirellula maris]TWT86736.1 RNA polymerase sigma factor [Pseudobythopirellula maris]